MAGEDDLFGDGPTDGESEEIEALYEEILAAGYESAFPGGEADTAALESLQGSASRLAEQLQNSILYAPWARTDIQAAIQNWMDGGDTLTLTELRDALEPYVGQMRALLIARTETAQVYNAAFAAGAKSAGYRYVRWIAAPDACPICIERATTNDGVMTVAEYEADPTGHPNCSCTAEPVDDDEAAAAAGADAETEA